MPPADRQPIPADRARRIRGFGTAVAMLLVGCASDEPETVDYVEEMTSICSETQQRIDALPEPPTQISPTNWAREVAGVIEGEAEDADDVSVTGDVRTIHRDYVTTTRDLAAAYAVLAELLGTESDIDATVIDQQRTEVTELSLGRDELADDLGVAACRRSAT